MINPASSLVVEVVEVPRDEDVDVAHDLEHVEALLQGLRRQSVVHGLKAGKLGSESFNSILFTSPHFVICFHISRIRAIRNIFPTISAVVAFPFPFPPNKLEKQHVNRGSRNVHEVFSNLTANLTVKTNGGTFQSSQVRAPIAPQ